MKNGDINDFINNLYYGGELVFEYAESKYFIQGWTTNIGNFMVLDYVSSKPFEKYLWIHEGKTMKECADAFLSAPLWNGKTFTQVQEEVTWSDW